VQIIGDPEELSAWCLLQQQVELVEARKQGARLRINSSELADAAQILHRMLKDGLKVTEFHREQRNLEDAFIDMLGKIDRGETIGSKPPPLPQAETSHTSSES
jgi:ABC-2 type transport system ATP-binding protein